MKQSQTKNQIEDAVRAISSAASDAVKTISAAAAEAKNVVSVNAAEAAKILNVTNSGDHDLLQRVDTKVDLLIKTVDSLSSRDNLFVLKDEFNLWRNILIVSMLGTIFVAVLLKFLVN